MKDELRALYEKYDALPETGTSFPDVPKHIRENLSYPLRPYQEEAVGRWLKYMDNDNVNKVSPVQLLFNMATGSGKTLIMAAMLLDLYKRGYRNFIYFVNSTNIIEKTRDNFKNSASNKYLFSRNIVIDGQHIEINEVENFSVSKDGAINIIFTTIQKLHADLTVLRENQLSYIDFENLKVALIGDEAHHNNSKTLLNKDEEEDNRSWEQTVSKIMDTAEEPILLEFTATIDLDDKNIYQKYRNRILYRYDLRHFRMDGFSKDVLIYHVDSDIEVRMLHAAIISQFRKKLALRNGFFLKPVVMFKSKTRAENKQNFQLFNNLIKNLSAEKIFKQRKNAKNILAEAFIEIGLSDSDLVEELKNDFMPERLLIIDGNNISKAKQLKLNSLEDAENELRAIFAVDMLNEGWDVLNLFDIVRLYDTRDARGGKVGKTTIREAQLIGRGARYFPFVIDDLGEKYVRKFDNNEMASLRLLEQLHYHSANNPRYIQEIRQALIESGVMAETYVERVLRLKDSFKKTKIYQDGVVFMNEQKTKMSCTSQLGKTSGSEILGWDFGNQEKPIEIILPSDLVGVVAIFEEQKNSAPPIGSETYESTFGNIVSTNIIRHALAKNKMFRFSNLREKMFGIASQEAFIKEISKKVHIQISGNNIDKGKLTPTQKLYIAQRVLEEIEMQTMTTEKQLVGTEKFIARKISDVFPSSIKRKYSIASQGSDREFGEPQANPKNQKYALDLSCRSWYAYDENYGTSEEKAFVKTFDGIFDELAKKWDDIYLVRNEGQLRIYNFEDGRPFEPDYLLFANDRKAGNVRYQIFIEPKGGALYACDKWKEDFLKELMRRKIVKTLADNSEMKIIGLPFYNEAQQLGFMEDLRDLAS